MWPRWRTICGVAQTTDEAGIDTVWVADHDVLSGGRAWLGLGAGYEGTEARSMGLTLPEVAERFEHLEDTLRLAHRMRTREEAPFHGYRHTVDGPLARPRPHRTCASDRTRDRAARSRAWSLGVAARSEPPKYGKSAPGPVGYR